MVRLIGLSDQTVRHVLADGPALIGGLSARGGRSGPWTADGLALTRKCCAQKPENSTQLISQLKQWIEMKIGGEMEYPKGK